MAIILILIFSFLSSPCYSSRGIFREVYRARNPIESSKDTEEIIKNVEKFNHPSSVGVSPQCEISNKINSKYEHLGETYDSASAKGARLTLATLYQSCLPLGEDIIIDDSTPRLKGVFKAKKIDGKTHPGSSSYMIRKITNIEKFVDSHIYLKELEKQKSDGGYPGEGCLDITKKPPIYGYGSRKRKTKKGKVEIFTKGGGVAPTSHDATGIDCSALLAAAYASQGLKFTENGKSYEAGLTTRSLSQSVDRKGSCIKRADVSTEETVKPGDILNYGGKHVVIINNVGKDPLGIEKALKNGSCKQISPADMNFSFIHSGDTRQSYGPSHVEANIYAKKPHSIFDNLILMARKLCLSASKGKSSGNSLDFNRNKLFSLSRHDSENEKCKGEPVPLEGQKCVEGCL